MVWKGQTNYSYFDTEDVFMCWNLKAINFYDQIIGSADITGLHSFWFLSPGYAGNAVSIRDGIRERVPYSYS